MRNRLRSGVLLLLLSSFAFAKEYNRHSIKLRCYQCNMPYQCESGSCYGDVCVKTSANDRYVVKGCENVTRSVTSDLYEPHMKHKSYCKTELVLGIDTTICYCRDGDFCNSSMSTSMFLPFFLLLALWRF